MTSNCQHSQKRSSLPKPQVFSKPPFKSQSASNVLPDSQEYDPQNNLQVSRKRTNELPNQSSHADKIRKLSNMNDLMTEFNPIERPRERIQPREPKICDKFEMH